MEPTRTAPPAFHVLAKPTGAICNLSCAYCFFLSKEMLYPGSTFRMADDLLETYIRQMVESQRVAEATIAWQGGEPTLMGLDFFRRAIAYEQTIRKPGTTILNTMQTNGTLLDDEWCSFFRESSFLVGLSLDGPRAMHDAYRLDKGGQPTFDRVMRAAALLRKHRVEFNILCAVHAANGDHPVDVYRFLRDEAGARFIQFIPIVEKDAKSDVERDAERNAECDSKAGLQEGGAVTIRSVQPEQYGRFLNGVFDEWVRRDVGQIFVQTFDAALASWVGAPPGVCIFAPTCGGALALEHNGDLYSCDHFVEPDYLLGNITKVHMSALVGSEKQHMFGQVKLDTLPPCCLECDVRFACNGECPKNRFLAAPGGQPGLNYLCAGYKLFFHHIRQPMRMMAALLQQRRPPSEVMLLLAAEEGQLQAAFAKAGRNNPCPCGSGLKFKRCHGKKI
jgi:uncharacterized protein